MRNKYILLYFLLFAAEAYPQQQELVGKDSLKILQQTISDYLDRYNYEDCIENAFVLIELAREANDPYYHYHGHNMLGVAYEELQDTARARKNYTQALKYALKAENDTLLLWAYNNLGNIYSESKGASEEGIAYYQKVIELSEKLQLEEESLVSRINLAWTYLDAEKYKSARPFLEESLKLLDEKEDPYVRSQLYMLLGRYYAKSKQIDSARFYFEDAAKIAEEDSLMLPASLVYEEYASMLFEEEDYEEAYTALHKHKEFNARIFETEKLEQIEAANASFNVREYEQNLELARKEQLYQKEMIKKSDEKMMLLMLFSGVLLIILLFLFSISRSRRRLIRELQVKNKLLSEAKDEAEKLSQLKTRFFSTVSHELRTPLYGAVGLASLLQEDERLHEHQGDLKALKFSADYLLALVNDVLQVNKMESNEVKLEQVPFNFPDLMQGLGNTFEYTGNYNQNEIHIEIDKELPEFLVGDPLRLSQVLMNLVGNAMKFTEQGNIFVSARKKEIHGEEVTIQFGVKDDGFGIPEDKQKIIFEEFSQLPSSNYNYQGTGLGLSIVKRLLHMFGSEIHLKSKQGCGSEFNFEITFKISKSAVENDSHIQKRSSTDPVVPKKILIVDDNLINQRITKRILEKQHFKCDLAKDGEEAIAKTRKGDYDLILMDLNMPEISGIEATEEIKKFNKTVQIVALTAVEIEEVREDISNAGMNDVIVKPYDEQEFFQVIHRSLAAARIKKNELS